MMLLCKSVALFVAAAVLLAARSDSKMVRGRTALGPDNLNRIDLEAGNHRHSPLESLHPLLLDRATPRSRGDDNSLGAPATFDSRRLGKKPLGQNKWIGSRSPSEHSNTTNFSGRKKRAVVDNGVIKTLRSSKWGHTEWLGDRDVALQWRTNGTGIIFRVEARAEGHVGLAIEQDAVLVWLDDQEHAKIMDCHLEDGIPHLDASHDYNLVFGLRNQTHLVVEFQRALDTCDIEDVVINSDNVNIQWTLGNGNPLEKGWKGWQGVRTLRLLNPKATIPGPNSSANFKRWDVVLRNYEVRDYEPSVFWVKIFKVPALNTKHHIVGYHPVSTSGIVRHAVLYECDVEAGAESGRWDNWANSNGSRIDDIPKEWGLCMTPVATWGVDSKGEMFPDHVGIPLGEEGGVTYYMLEIHCENLLLKKVVDDFGLTILYTDELRQYDAGVMVSGITVSPLHVLPANQPKYRSAGYCSEACTNAMFPSDGINVVSVLLHAHNAKEKLTLRHIRNGEELPKIAEDDYFEKNNKNQQSRVLLEERTVLPGDALITECTYNTQGRMRPTLGGYSSKQEMCLAFILHYPRTHLTGCYSMTPVKEFFETFGVKEFFSIDMVNVENMFLNFGFLDGIAGGQDLADGNQDTMDLAIQGDDQGVSVLGKLLIKEPFEFRNKTFIAHLNEIPWSEPLLTKRIEDTLYKGKHMTFCRKRDESLAIPAEIRIFPNFSEVIPSGNAIECLHKLQQKNMSTSSSNKYSSNVYHYIIIGLIYLLL